MIDMTSSNLSSWIRALILNPNVNKKLLKRDVWTSEELLDIYDPAKEQRLSVNGMSRALSAASVTKVYDGRAIKLRNGVQNRYFIIRNKDIWETAEHNKLVDHIEQSK